MFARRLLGNVGSSTSRSSRGWKQATQRRRFGAGGGHDHHGPHIPEFHDKLGKFCLVSAFFWIMYRAKENKGQLFGWYAPWLHEHDHEHLHYVSAGDQGDTMPTLEEHDEEHEDEEDDEH